MPPTDTLPHLFDFVINFDGGMRLIQYARQIYVAGYSLMQWAFMWMVFIIAVQVVRYIMRYVYWFAGLPPSDVPVESAASSSDAEYRESISDYLRRSGG